MTDFIVTNMAPLMFVSLIVVLLLGYPVAFSLAAIGLGWGIVGIELGLFHPLFLGSSRVDLQACKLEYSIVSPK